MRYGTSLFLGLAICAIGLAGAAKNGVKLQFSFADSQPADKTYSITISGTVTDAKTGKAISGAEVRGHVAVWRYYGPELFAKSPYRETRTDDQGRYSLTFNTPLTMTGPWAGKDSGCVYVNAPGYETRPQYVPGKITPSRLSVTDFNFSLGAGKAVKGRVIDEGGRPVADARVRVLNGWNGDWTYFGALGMARTDANGEFLIWISTDREQVIGRPWILVSKAGYGTEFFWKNIDEDAMGGLTLHQGGAVTGRVVDKSGKGVAGCEVFARWGSHEVEGKVVTDRDGTYRLTGIPGEAGLTRFCLWHSSKRKPMTTVDVYARAYPEADMNSAPTYKVVVKEGATVTGPDMVVGGQGSVSGKLIPSKTTLFGLKGLLVRLDYDWSNMTTADADGRFGFAAVNPGKHRLTAYLPTNLRGDRGIGSIEVDVPAGQSLENVTIGLETLAETRVQFLDAGGNPLEGMTAGATWTKSGEGFWTQGTESDKDGWAVLFLYPGQVQYVRGFDMDNHRLVSEGFVEVNPTAGQVIDNLRITMVATAKVHGRLEMEGGGSFEGKRLALKLTYADGLERRENIRPDAAGAFVLDKVKPGVATVELETLPAELTGIIGAAMEIKPGEDKDLGGIALRKIKYYTVKGQLAGSPTFSNLEGFKIRVDLMAWEPMNPTDKDGRFVLPKVPAGKHRLIAYLPYNLRMDRGVGHVEIDVPDKDIEGVKLPLETLATVRMRIADPAGKPVEGVSAAAWWTVDHSGVFTEGTRSDKDGRATLYMYPDDLQYVGAHDWDNRYELKGDVKTTPKPGQVVDDLKIIMVPAAK